MQNTISPVDGVIDSKECAAISKIVNDEGVTGFAIIDRRANRLAGHNLGDGTVAVFAEIMEKTELVGAELGEDCPRPTVMFAGQETYLVGFPFRHTNLVVAKTKTMGVDWETRYAR